MRQSQKSNRPRNKNGRKPSSGPSLNRVYESSGPEGKVRGTPQQIVEKYQSLARDKSTSGDRVMAENFLQHAEHYMRILTAAQPAPRQEERSEEPRGEESRVAAEARFDESAEEGQAIEGLAVIGEDDDDVDNRADLVETPESAGDNRREDARREEEGGEPPRRRRRPLRRSSANVSAGAEDEEENGSSRPRRRRSPRNDADVEASAPATIEKSAGESNDGEPVRAAE